MLNEKLGLEDEWDKWTLVRQKADDMKAGAVRACGLRAQLVIGKGYQEVHDK